MARIYTPHDEDQHPFSMNIPHPRHNGLLHHIEASASAVAAAAAAAASKPTLNGTFSVSQSGNITHNGENNNGTESAEQPVRRYRPIWYLSRGYQIIALAIILLLACHHLVIRLRHKNRIRHRLRNCQGRRSRDKYERRSSIGGHAASIVEERLSGNTVVQVSLPKQTDEDRLLPNTCSDEETTRGRPAGRYWFAAWEASQRNWLYLRTIPGWLYGPETMADAIWTGVYTVTLMTFALATIPLNEEFWYLHFANGIGILAFCQCPLIIILIQKNNLISSLTGITYQKLNYLHRAASRVALLFSWIHFLLWTPRVWVAGHFSHWYIIWGLIAIFGFTGLWITSFRFVRRVAFEFFLVAHILFTIVFIGGAILHWYRLQYWLWPCFALWVLDRFIRGLKMLYINPPSNLRWFKTTKSPTQAGSCEIKLLSPDVMLLTAKRPGLKWTAGQHFFLSCPSVSTLLTETHPFSIANMPNERDEAVFLIRVHSGFTRRLRDALKGELTTDIPVYLEGPYGSSHSLSSYSTVILIAGGTGITFLSSNLLGLLQPHTPQIPRHIHLVWHIRHASDIKWLSSLLNEAVALSAQHPQTKLTFDIHVTKSHRADEPAPAVGFTDRLVEEFAPRRFSRRFSNRYEQIKRETMGDLSEMPSAVASDDEEEESSGTATAGSSYDSRAEASVQVAERIDRLDEVDRLAEEQGEDEATTELLPKRPVDLHPTTRMVDSMGMAPETAAVTCWKKGRADLREVLEGDLETTTGPINVTVCGPVQLMHAARRAVKDVATPQRTIRGEWPVDFYEETLGS